MAFANKKTDCFSYFCKSKDLYHIYHAHAAAFSLKSNRLLPERDAVKPGTCRLVPEMLPAPLEPVVFACGWKSDYLTWPKGLDKRLKNNA